MREFRAGVGQLRSVVFALCLFGAAPRPAAGLTLELAGLARFRPQNTTKPLSTTSKTVLLSDDSLNVIAVLRSAAGASPGDSLQVLVLQVQKTGSSAWKDFRVLFDHTPAQLKVPTSPLTPTLTKVGATSPTPGTPTTPVANIDVSGLAPRPETSPVLPQDPTKPPQPKLSPIQPADVVSEFGGPSFTLPVGSIAVRAEGRRGNGTVLDSAPFLIEVRNAPDILTLIAMGGTCIPEPNGDTHFTSLADGQILRDKDVCASKGVDPAFLADLTPMASVNCNDFCNTGCTNFFEHLALRIMNDRGLADALDAINNPGDKLCDPRTNKGGVHNHIMVGKWRNTEEELACGTPIKFDKIIDEFRATGGKSLILIGQSQGGAKFAGMVRDHWHWGDDIHLELLVLWDATSFDVVSFSGHPGITSMGVRKVGPHPKRILDFFQYSNLVPFQNGAPMDPTEPHSNLEQVDLDGCFSHNGIARSQFVHHHTADVVGEVIRTIRDRARS